MMQEDQAIAEIREVRRRISEECDHDPRAIRFEFPIDLRKAGRKRPYRRGAESARRPPPSRPCRS
jgi:hypothetical protein